MSRLLTLTEGRAMVVTDLHGDWELYCKYRDHFLNLQSRGEADYLIFTGDLIHSEAAEDKDKSLEIVLDVIRLKAEWGEKVVYLLGNHEMPHLYAITLQKGNVVYTPQFEARMKEYRPKIMELFDSLPFFIRTNAGVSIAHAGAAKSLTQSSKAKLIFNFSHRDLWTKAQELIPIQERPSLRDGFARLNRANYVQMTDELLAIHNPDDPRFDDLLISSMVRLFPEFDLLWETLFNKNEHEYGDSTYTTILDNTLIAFSEDFCPQRFLVSGHIACSNGYQMIGKRQLRLASGVHAKPLNSCKYLMFDIGKPVENLENLAQGVTALSS